MSILLRPVESFGPSKAAILRRVQLGHVLEVPPAQVPEQLGHVLEVPPVQVPVQPGDVLEVPPA